MMRISVNPPREKKPALGRGLSALISDDIDISAQRASISGGSLSVDAEENGIKAVMLKVNDLSPGRFQPRSYFDEEKLRELTDSVRENGVLQPILVRKEADGKYQIIAGERRWRASKQAGLEKIPAIIKDLTDKVALEVALIENIQRQSLTPIEEAEGYRKLIDEFAYTQEELASVIGKSRSHITNMMRLLQLPEEIKDMINSGALTVGHARALINAENAIDLAKQIASRGLTVREAEKFAAGSGKTARSEKGKSQQKTPSAGGEISAKDEDLLALEQALSNSLGLKVAIEDGANGGKVTLHFNNLTQLDAILQKLS